METIEELLAGGYRIWRKNPVLMLPHLLHAAVSLGLIVSFCVATVLYFIFLIALGAVATYAGDSFNWWTTTGLAVAIIGLVGVALFVLVYILADSFFSAASAGMSKKALESGSTYWSDMIEYGTKYFFKLFIARLSVLALNAAGLIFLVPAAFALLYGTINLAIALGLMGAVLFTTYFALLYASFYPLTYSVVIGEHGAYTALGDSCRFAMRNKTGLVIMIFISMSIGTIITVFIEAFASLFTIIPILGLFVVLAATFIGLLFNQTVILPLLYLWWAGFYMSRNSATTHSSAARPRSFWKNPLRENRVRPSLSSL